MMSTNYAQDCCCRPLAEALAAGVVPAGGASLLLLLRAGDLFYRLTGGRQDASPAGANEPVFFCMFCGADLRAGQSAPAPRCDATFDDGDDDEMTLLASEPTLVSV
jgi:hypothetical protein